ncbi:unnamed protein product [Amoebophrya sp. A25]|nr:unnamed protein product [Amoebophrya sp. A25]CAD7977235.1 unnamed protein product [Amoebophrya sp. A25]|eukprot:GSA25T00028074001.1
MSKSRAKILLSFQDFPPSLSLGLGLGRSRCRSLDGPRLERGIWLARRLSHGPGMGSSMKKCKLCPIGNTGLAG